MKTQFRVCGQSSRGFTLIELMIVVAVVAILTAIAIPAYNSYVTRSKLTEAFSGLSGMSLAMQQYDQDNRSYLAAAGGATTCPVLAPTATKYFSFACSGVTATTYLLTATGTAPDLIGVGYTIDQDGSKTTIFPATGWTLPNPNNCWARDQAGDC